MEETEANDPKNIRLEVSPGRFIKIAMPKDITSTEIMDLVEHLEALADEIFIPTHKAKPDSAPPPWRAVIAKNGGRKPRPDLAYCED